MFLTEDRRSIFGAVPVSWINFVDHGSGIGGYSVAIVDESINGAANGTNAAWHHAALAGSTLYNMVLEHGQQYYTVVSAWDGLGNERKCYSNGTVHAHEHHPCVHL